MTRESLNTFSLESWLFKKRTWKEKKKAIFLLFLINFFVTISVTLFSILRDTPNSLPSNYFYDPEVLDILKTISENLGIALLVFWAGFVALALFEELIFRFPLTFFINKKINFNYKLIFICMLSFLFGSLHATSDSNFLGALAIQGTGGILLSFIFIVAGGAEKKYLSAFAITVLAHFLLNIIATIYVPITAVISILS